MIHAVLIFNTHGGCSLQLGLLTHQASRGCPSSSRPSHHYGSRPSSRRSSRSSRTAQRVCATFSTSPSSCSLRLRRGPSRPTGRARRRRAQTTTTRESSTATTRRCTLCRLRCRGHSDARFVVDGAESELGILDLIQVFVESLDRAFENVCELDLIFHFDEVRGCVRGGVTDSGAGAARTRGDHSGWARPRDKHQRDQPVWCVIKAAAALTIPKPKRHNVTARRRPPAQIPCCHHCSSHRVRAEAVDRRRTDHGGGSRLSGSRCIVYILVIHVRCLPVYNIGAIGAAECTNPFTLARQPLAVALPLVALAAGGSGRGSLNRR